jgi:hypothetical protein
LLIPEAFPVVNSGQVLTDYLIDYPSGGAKGYNLKWKPDKRTATIRADIEDVLLQYWDYWPLGPRQVGYILIGGYAYIKTDEHFTRVGYILERGRRALWESVGPNGTKRSWWEAVADGRTPDPLTPGFYDSPEDFVTFMHEQATGYSCDLQTGQTVAIEIWVETASLAPQVARIAHAYGVQVYPSSGETALAARRNIALRAVVRARRGIRTLILHIGDYDAKGVAIYRVLEADVLAFAAAHRVDGMVACQRLAVTPEQVECYELERDPVKLPRGEKKSPGPPLPFNCQAEALNPEQLDEVVRGGMHYQDPQLRAMAEARSRLEKAMVLRSLKGIKLQRRLHRPCPPDNKAQIGV